MKGKNVRSTIYEVQYKKINIKKSNLHRKSYIVNRNFFLATV
jgi:hypothetical protein